MSADGDIAGGEAAKVAVRRPRGRRSGADSGDTRLSLLDAAEKLFAERGFYGVTTRQVAREAGVDEAMIFYHCQNKQGLFDAVFERRARVLHRTRHESLLAYVAQAQGEISVDGTITAFLNPMFDLSESGEPGWKSYFALVAQIDNTPWGREIIHRFFDPIIQELIAILRLARPDAEDRELYWAYNFVSGAIMISLAETGRIDHLSDGLRLAGDLAAVRGRLIAFCVGGINRVLDGSR